MTRYHFLAYASDGRAVRGALEAGSTDDAVRRLQGAGRFPIEVSEDRSGWLARALAARLAVGQRVAPQQVVRLTQDLAALLRAGLTIDRALGVLADSYRDRPLAPHLAAVHDRLRRGLPLAAAMARTAAVFPASYTSVVAAGERAGALPVALDRLARSLARAQQLHETVRSALIYPTVLLLLSGVSIAIVLTVIVPEFRPMLADAHVELALTTRALLALSDALDAAWWSLPLAVLLAVAAVALLRRRPGVVLAWDRLLLRLPLVGTLVRKSEAVRLCETLGTLLGNGVAMTTAITSAGATRCCARASPTPSRHSRKGRDWRGRWSATACCRRWRSS